ncbi:MAG: hypothetical protein ABSD20_15325 [Terriglobales bacterium]|jgi:hypothetical protein
MRTPRFSVIAVLAALLCIAPGALAQGAAHSRNVVLSEISASVLTLGPSADRQNGNGGGRCNQDWGRQQGGNGQCGQVPEGGTTVAYVSLAGLCCLAAAMFRARRRVRSVTTS